MQNLLDQHGLFKARHVERDNWVWGACTRCDAQFLPKKPVSRFANNAGPVPLLCGFCASSTGDVQ